MNVTTEVKMATSLHVGGKQLVMFVCNCLIKVAWVLLVDPDTNPAGVLPSLL